MNTIDQLPNSLSTISVTSKSNESTFGYFGELNLLSNFNPSPFTLYDQECHCSEQYIQEAKAKYFNDTETYAKLHPPPASYMQRQHDLSGQSASNHMVNHCPGYSLIATPSVLISSNKQADSHLTITDNEQLVTAHYSGT